jgi:hypothetical protein
MLSQYDSLVVEEMGFLFTGTLQGWMERIVLYGDTFY